MEKKIEKVTTEKTSISFSVKEIEDIIILYNSGFVDAEFRWDECSGGGVNGCTITKTVITRDTNNVY